MEIYHNDACGAICEFKGRSYAALVTGVKEIYRYATSGYGRAGIISSPPNAYVALEEWENPPLDKTKMVCTRPRIPRGMNWDDFLGTLKGHYAQHPKDGGLEIGVIAIGCREETPQMECFLASQTGLETKEPYRGFVHPFEDVSKSSFFIPEWYFIGDRIPKMMQRIARPNAWIPWHIKSSDIAIAGEERVMGPDSLIRLNWYESQDQMDKKYTARMQDFFERMKATMDSTRNPEKLNLLLGVALLGIDDFNDINRDLGLIRASHFTEEKETRDRMRDVRERLGKGELIGEGEISDVIDLFGRMVEYAKDGDRERG